MTSTIVAAGVGATFNLLRLSTDLITTALEAAKRNEDNIENSKTGANQSDSIADTAGTSRRSSLLSGRRLSVINFNGRLSFIQSKSTSKESRKRTQMTNNGADIGSSVETVDIEQVKKGEIDPDSDDSNKRPKTTLQTLMPTISITIHFILLGYFLSATVLTATSDLSRPEYANAMYDSIPLGCATVAIFLGILMNFRDFQRKRFSSLQKGLYSLSALILLAGCLVLISLPPSSTEVDQKSPTKVDIATVVSLGIYAILAITEGRVCPKPVVLIKEGKKAKLNKRALLTILKPYFWPDKTATSATVNRIRAISTWIFVILSKASLLTAPILLGKASTALSRGEYSTAIQYSIYYTLAQLTSFVFKEAQSLVYLSVGQAAFVQLSELSFNHLLSLSLDWHLRKKLGEVIRSMDRGIAACDMLMKYLFLWLVPAIAECILVTIIFASYFDYFPLAVSVFFFVLIYILWTILVTLWRKKFRKQVAKSDNDWHDKCTDSLINFETVKYFTAEEYESKRFSDSVKKFQVGTVNVQASLSLLNVSQQLLLQCCLATSLSLAVISIRDRMNCCLSSGCTDGNSQCCSNLDAICPGLEIGDFIAVLTYTLNLFMPLNFLGTVYNMIVMSLVDLANLSELLMENPDVVDAPDAMPLPLKNLDDPDVVVEFDNVIFHYPTQPDTKGLKGLSFKMKRGTVTAVVGPTGEGKTTVSRLLFRFYDVVGGAVKINGMDVRSMKQKSLRGAIGVVPQNSSLFNDTLRNNIRYGNQSATDDEIMQVVEDAQLKGFIDSLPEGWDTLVGDRGLKLSGGEKQRCAIARCLLKNPSIVVLDEATSALDSVTENSVQDALDRLGSDRTVLVIAHRLGTIRMADNIIVLGNGRVTEEGTHEELLALNGKYAEMWNMQLHSARGKNDKESMSATSAEE